LLKAQDYRWLQYHLNKLSANNKRHNIISKWTDVSNLVFAIPLKEYQILFNNNFANTIKHFLSMNTLIALLSTIFFIFPTFVFAQNLNANWRIQLTKSVEESKNCQSTASSNYNSCTRFIGESLDIVYGLKDFYSKDLNRNLTGTEIIKYLETNNSWVAIGPAYDQSSLDQAQKLSNSGIAVVAVYLDKDKLGNVSIILPGEQSASGSWGLKVPNSVAYFVNTPQKSYLNKGLSYAFTRNMIKDVIIYKKVN
jgi:hypothetical protein